MKKTPKKMPAKNVAPESYRQGIRYIECLTANEMIDWLEGELRGTTQVLAGRGDDFPVQAILNHYRYLSFKAQRGVDTAIEALVLDWKQNHEKWVTASADYLLSLVAELPVPAAKYKLQSLVESKVFSRVTLIPREDVLRTIATLSVNDDRAFWNKVAEKYPKFAGMAFQVLARIAPADALLLLEQLPEDESVFGSVARSLPDFLSQERPGEDQRQVTTRVAKAIGLLSRNPNFILRVAVKESGFDI